jgi:hypothetical protein
LPSSGIGFGQIEDRASFFDDNYLYQQIRNVNQRFVVVSYAEKIEKIINNLYHSKEIDIVEAGLDRNYFFYKPKNALS